MSSTDKINTQSEQRGAATASGYGTDNKTTLPPLGSTMKTEQPELYTQTQQQQPYEYNVQPSIYSSYQQSNYDPYQRQSSLQPQNAYAGMTQYTQQAYPSTNASGAVRFLYSGNSASAVPASTSKQDLHTHVPPEKKSRRFRRRYNQIVRKYPCSFPGCLKSYGSLNHLNTHIVTKKHGPRKSKLDFQNGGHNKDDKLEPNFAQQDHAAQPHVQQPAQYLLPQQSQMPVPTQQYVTQPNDYSGYYYGYSAPPNLRPNVSNDSSLVPVSGSGLYYLGLQPTSTLVPQQTLQIQPQRSGGSTSTPQYYQATPQQTLYASLFQPQQQQQLALGSGIYANQQSLPQQQRTNRP